MNKRTNNTISCLAESSQLCIEILVASLFEYFTFKFNSFLLALPDNISIMSIYWASSKQAAKSTSSRHVPDRQTDRQTDRHDCKSTTSTAQLLYCSLCKTSCAQSWKLHKIACFSKRQKLCKVRCARTQFPADTNNRACCDCSTWQLSAKSAVMTPDWKLMINVN